MLLPHLLSCWMNISLYTQQQIVKVPLNWHVFASPCVWVDWRLQALYLLSDDAQNVRWKKKKKSLNALEKHRFIDDYFSPSLDLCFFPPETKGVVRFLCGNLYLWSWSLILIDLRIFLFWFCLKSKRDNIYCLFRREDQATERIHQADSKTLMSVHYCEKTEFELVSTQNFFLV